MNSQQLYKIERKWIVKFLLVWNLSAVIEWDSPEAVFGGCGLTDMKLRYLAKEEWGHYSKHGLKVDKKHSAT